MIAITTPTGHTRRSLVGRLVRSSARRVGHCCRTGARGALVMEGVAQDKR
jgi:hypothetical protein